MWRISYRASLDVRLNPQGLASSEGIVGPRHGFLKIHVNLSFHSLSSPCLSEINRKTSF
jgi:hypothetical protein